MAKRKSDFHRKPRFARLARTQTPEERKELKAQIEKDGCEEPIVIMQGDVIVDGHHRDEICCELGIDTPFKMRNFRSEDEAEKWAIRRQLGRRNLSSDDFRMLLGRLYNATKPPQGKPKPEGASGLTADEVAEEHGVSERTVRKAGKRAEAYDNLAITAQKFVDSHKVSDENVIALSKKPKSEQQQIVRDHNTGTKTLSDALGNGKPKTPKIKKPKTTAVDAKKARHSIAVQYFTKGMQSLDDYFEVNQHKSYHASCMQKCQAILKDLQKWK